MIDKTIVNSKRQVFTPTGGPRTNRLSILISPLQGILTCFISSTVFLAAVVLMGYSGVYGSIVFLLLIPIAHGINKSPVVAFLQNLALFYFAVIQKAPVSIIFDYVCPDLTKVCVTMVSKHK